MNLTTISFTLMLIACLLFAYLNYELSTKYMACQNEYQTLTDKLERLVNTPPNKIPDIEVQLLMQKGKEI